jgi:hypothetical protein
MVFMGAGKDRKYRDTEWCKTRLILAIPPSCSLRAEDVNIVAAGFASEAKFGLVTELKSRCNAVLFQLLLKLRELVTSASVVRL